MTEDHIGRACALLAALTWAVALILFKRSGEVVPPLALNLFKSTIGLVLLAITLLVTGDGFDTLSEFSRGDITILLLSGLIGIALADTLFFHALNLIGVGIVAIVDCLYAPFIILFSFLLLVDPLTLSDLLGAGLVVAGVFVSSRHKPPANRTHKQLIAGILLGCLAMAFMTFGIVFATPVLDLMRFPLIWATAIRLLAGAFALALLMLASPQRRQLWSVFRPSPIWKVAVPASVLGNYIALVFWVAGFKYTEAAVAGVLNQMSTIFAIILAAIFLREGLTRRKLTAVTLAAIGVVIVTFDPL